MGPRHWSRGRRRRAVPSVGERLASMGPRTGVVEDGRAREKHPRLMASMGPRHWSRGRQYRLIDRDLEIRRFNGATTLESWKTAIQRRSRSP